MHVLCRKGTQACIWIDKIAFDRRLKCTPERTLEELSSSAKRRERRQKEKNIIEKVLEGLEAIKVELSMQRASMEKFAAERGILDGEAHAPEKVQVVPGTVHYVEVPQIQYVYSIVEIPVVQCVQKAVEVPMFMQNPCRNVWDPAGHSRDHSPKPRSIESEDERSKDMRSLPGESSASIKAVERAEKKALRNQPKTTSLYEKPKRAKSDGNTMTMLASTSVASRGPGGRQVEKDDAKQMRGEMVNLRFHQSGKRSSLRYGDREPLGRLMQTYCKENDIQIQSVKFQVWENEIMDIDTWVDFLKKHNFEDFLDKRNPDENDLMIDVVFR